MVMIDITKPTKLVLAMNPWLSGELAKAAEELGITVSKTFYFRNPPPWSHVRMGLKAGSEAQKRVWMSFGEVAAETYGKPIAERIKTIRERLAGRSFPGKKYSYRTLPSGRKVPAKPRRELYKKIKTLLGGGEKEVE